MSFRIPEAHRRAIRAVAMSRGMTFSDYMRKMMEEHLMSLYDSRNSLYDKRERLDSLIRRFILLCRSNRLANRDLSDKDHA